MLMQNLIDLLAAGFVFLLFASIYRKRSTAAVRFWLAAWFFVLVHFAAAAVHPRSTAGVLAQTVVVLGTLILCGIAFVLSREETRKSRQDAWVIAGLLGVPWLAAIVLLSLPDSYFVSTVVCAYVASAAMLFVVLRYFRAKRVQALLATLVVLGCVGWLTAGLPLRSEDLVLDVVLTQCFGLNAVLLSGSRSRFSAATATTSVGAVAWGLVWVAGALVDHFRPGMRVSPEIWNLPKYVVAAGMILTLLEEEIRSAEIASGEYRLLFAGNPHPMWMYDPATLRFLQVNESAVAHYGYRSEEFRAMSLLDVFSDEYGGDDLKEKLRDPEPQQLSGPWLHRRKDGSTLQVDIASQPVMQDGRYVIFAMMHDVTDRQRLHAQLMRQAHHDVLTDLPNRVLFEQRLESALERARRTGRKVPVFCIDLDRFKQINDSYGHAAGDLCLKMAASRITALVGDRGTLARSGGDEFMLFVSDLQQVDEVEVLAGRLLHDLREALPVGTGELEISASVGFAVYPDDGLESGQLWRDADAAMYQAKRAGGGQWIRISSEISDSANQANEIEMGLRRALKAGNIEVHYQPQMSVDGHLHSFEALFRSKDPALRAVSPLRVIEIAEESGLIVPLGHWMLDEVCRQCREWAQQGLGPVQMAVNVSPLQLTRFDFAREVASTLQRYDLDARMLEFEVTESTMMAERESDAPHQIATLARMGIRFSVDDFGTGYSSLGRLHQLPVESLKIDCSFTRRIGEFNGTYPTVEAIVALAHTFGMKVVAEGVETDQQLRLLRKLGCDRVQGFLFSRPLSGGAATEFMQAAQEIRMHESVA
jgi:diguanylate cyclase (GGDEF)-like protein/PAS domain S-box-containing protein